MKREDWLAAGVLAAAVALAVVAVGSMPRGWAEDPVRVAIPALRPAELKIPSLGATIRATAQRKPGQGVVVTLDCDGAAAYSGKTVPLRVGVFRIGLMAMVSRVETPRSQPSPEMAGAECSLVIDASGKGRATVELPLTWTSDDAAKPEKGKLGGSYYMQLSSPLAPTPVTLPPPTNATQVSQRQVG